MNRRELAGSNRATGALFPGTRPESQAEGADGNVTHRLYRGNDESSRRTVQHDIQEPGFGSGELLSACLAHDA